jgi:hypothetical protein
VSEALPINAGLSSFTPQTPAPLPPKDAKNQAEQNCFFEKKQQKTLAPTRQHPVIAREARQSTSAPRHAG